jgi:putative transposase
MAGRLKTVTSSKAADGWYVSFSCAEVPPQPVPLTGRETGIDVGVKGFLISADGELVATPRYSRRAELSASYKKPRSASISCRQKGSKRQVKAVRQWAKKHQHVRRQRTDFHHKTALALVRPYARTPGRHDLARGDPAGQPESPSGPCTRRHRELSP